MQRTIRIILTAILMVSASLILLPTSASAVTSQSPVADSYTDDSSPSTNFGTKLYTYADASPRRTTYTKFSVASVPETPVKLRYFAESGSNTGIVVSTVADDSWTEREINHANAPALGDPISSPAPIKAGSWVTVDVTSVVTGPGTYSFGFTTSSTTGIKFTSREGVNKPELRFGTPEDNLSPFTITRNGNSYTASSPSGTSYTGNLKAVGQQAVADLDEAGGGTVQFTAGTFDFGADFFKLENVANISFIGAGMNDTIIQNESSAAADTEPFNFSGAENVLIKDMTISAGGPARSTSDAIDFDKGNRSKVENVAIIASRAKAIVFDGKNAGWTADYNTVTNCRIDGVQAQGIEFLASSHNSVSGCIIENTTGVGIQVGKASSSADQPNKKSNDNLIEGNTVSESGRDGILVNSGDDNVIRGNVVKNSSDDVTSRDGIRIQSSDGITCNDNVIENNISTDDQAVKTQRYGVLINNSQCARTVVRGNDLAGNRVAPLKDLGTGTIIVQ